jgi:hypothetical protein
MSKKFLKAKMGRINQLHELYLKKVTEQKNTVPLQFLLCVLV